MRPHRIWGWLLVVSVLVGCAGIPSDPDGHARYYLDRAKSAASRGNDFDMRAAVHLALNVAPGPSHARTYFAENPEMALRYVEASKTALQSPHGPHMVERERDWILALKQSVALPSDMADELIRVLDEAAAQGNLSGDLPFTLQSDLHGLPFADEPAHKALILDRAIAKTISTDSRYQREVSALMAYAAAPETPHEHRERVRKSLPDLKIRADELAAVAAVFPDFANQRRSDVTTTAVLQTKGMDRIEEDDIRKSLAKHVKGVEWLPAPANGTTVITIEKVRHNERAGTPQRETITYAQYQVGIFAAALLMPRNASYMYDRTTNVSEIEYGYVVSAVRGGEAIYDSLLRERLATKPLSAPGQGFRTCSAESVRPALLPTTI